MKNEKKTDDSSTEKKFESDTWLFFLFRNVSKYIDFDIYCSFKLFRKESDSSNMADSSI